MAVLIAAMGVDVDGQRCTVSFERQADATIHYPDGTTENLGLVSAVNKQLLEESIERAIAAAEAHRRLHIPGTAADYVLGGPGRHPRDLTYTDARRTRA